MKGPLIGAFLFYEAVLPLGPVDYISRCDQANWARPIRKHWNIRLFHRILMAQDKTLFVQSLEDKTPPTRAGRD